MIRTPKRTEEMMTREWEVRCAAGVGVRMTLNLNSGTHT